MFKNLLFGCLVAFSFLFVTSSNSFAQTSPGTEFTNITIENFGQMDERFYRGAQPAVEDFQALKDIGITTVINLRNDPEDYEKEAVERLGMKYVHISMSGWKTPKDEDLKTFMTVVNNPETGKFYVHCKAGIHRTGVAGAVYRFENYGWDYDTAYKEMKNYNFTWWMVHGKLKSYVKDYYKRMEKDKKVSTENTAQAVN